MSYISKMYAPILYRIKSYEDYKMLALYLNDINGQPNKDKFEEIYRIYEQKMYAIAYKILRHKENAEDAVHDALEVIVKKIDTIGEVRTAKTWNYIQVIVKNKAIRIYNSKKGKKEFVTDDINLLVDIQNYFEDVETIATRNDMVNYMANILLELPEKCREVMYLRYYNELSYADVAEILDTTEENARQIARRTRKMLAKKLTEQGVTL